MLPEVEYAGINFTMPDLLWPIFQQNRHLLHDLPVIGAEVINQWAKAKYGVKVLVMVVQHTFGSDLKFNPHLHILVSACGLRDSSASWERGIVFDKQSLMSMWRYAVITLLRRALKANLLTSNLTEPQLKRLFTTQYERHWIIYRDSSMSKRRFLGYAARYVRRPPIAQRRFIRVDNDGVEFIAKQRKKPTIIHYPARQFVERLAEHVPDRYRHNIRYFGLLAPRAKHRSLAAVFALLRQEVRPRPRRVGWRQSLIKYFKRDPLLDHAGHRMTWVRREKSASS
jgi:hypothetical protein